MIYKFKSKGAGDVIMLGPSGDRVLRLLGREPAPKGIIEVAAMPDAIATLERAVQDDEQRRADAAAQAEQPDEASHAPEGQVSLRQRVWPLIEMMRQCHAQGHDIVWGV